MLQSPCISVFVIVLMACWAWAVVLARLDHPPYALSLLQGRRLRMEDQTDAILATCYDTHEQVARNVSLFGVYDGHSGPWVSQTLAQTLLKDVLLAMGCEPTTTFHPPPHHHPAQPSANLEEQLLKLQFAVMDKQLQQQWVWSNQQVWADKQQTYPDAATETGAAATQKLPDAGSTALVILLLRSTGPGADSDKQELAGSLGTRLLPVLVIANVGNSRAVLCQSRSGGNSTSTASSTPAPQDSTSTTAGTSAGANTSTSDSEQQQQQQEEQQPAVPIALTAAERYAARRKRREQQRQDPTQQADQPPSPWTALELTPLHEASNKTEAARVAGMGGFVAVSSGGGVLRLAGELELTRAFGDLAYRGVGLTAEPDLNQHPITPSDCLLVMASDGLFEVLTPEQVCGHAAAQALGLPHPPRSPPAPEPIVLMGATSPTLGSDASGHSDAKTQPHQDDGSDGGGVDASDEVIAELDALELDLGLDGDQQGQEEAEDVGAGATAGKQGQQGTAMMQAIADRLTQEAYNRGSGDNLAVIVVDLRALWKSDSETEQGDDTGGGASAQQLDQRVDGAMGSPVSSSLARLHVTEQPEMEHVEGWESQLMPDESSDAWVLPAWARKCEARPASVTSAGLCAVRSNPHVHTFLKHMHRALVRFSFMVSVARRVLLGPKWADGPKTGVVPVVGQGGVVRCDVEGDESPECEARVGRQAMCSKAVGDGVVFDEHHLDVPARLTSRYELTGFIRDTHGPDGDADHTHWQHVLQHTHTPMLLRSEHDVMLRLPTAGAGRAQVVSAAGGGQQGLNDPPEWWAVEDLVWETDADSAVSGGASVTDGKLLSSAGGVLQGGDAASGAAANVSSFAVDLLATQHTSDGGGGGGGGGSDAAGQQSSGIDVAGNTPAVVSTDTELGSDFDNKESIDSNVAIGSGVDANGAGVVGSSSHAGAATADAAADVAPAGLDAAVLSPPDSTTPDLGLSAEVVRMGRMLLGMQEVGLGAGTAASLKESDMRQSDSQTIDASAAPYRSHSKYRLDKKFGAGHFGEVWDAVLRPHQHDTGSQGHHQEHLDSTGETPAGPRLVLKRVFAERGAELYQAGLREVHFGRLLAQQLTHKAASFPQHGMGGHVGHAHHVNLQVHPHPGLSHVVRFVEAFQIPRLTPEPVVAPGGDTSRAARAGMRGHPPPPPPPPPAARDLWLVFHHAGRSLHDLMYEPVSPGASGGGGDVGSSSGSSSGGGGFQVLGPSRWWWGMRQASREGCGPMKDLLQQLLLALDALQSLNITHRDIKADNLMLGRPAATDTGLRGPHRDGAHKPADMSAAGPFSWVGNEQLTLIDFGSAIDSYTLSAGMWGSQGPGDEQTTAEYAPPEALFARFWDNTRAIRPRLWAYDMWSVGVVWLEMLLGTPDVWALPASIRAMLEARLTAARRPQADRASAHLLRGLMEWCVRPPARPPRSADKGGKAGAAPVDMAECVKGGQCGDGAATGQAHNSGSSRSTGHSPYSQSMVPWECTDGAVLETIRARDPSGLGLGSNLDAVDLLRQLLSWSPASRPTAAQALAHPYFTRCEQQQQHPQPKPPPQEKHSASAHGSSHSAHEHKP